MHRKKIRRSFLLVEILTASFVAGIVIAACLSVLVLFTVVRSKEDLHFRAAQKQLQATTSLRSILSFIEMDSSDDKFSVEDGPFGQKELIFHVNTRYNIIPGRSGDSKAKIYVDPDKGLVFVQKAIPKKAETKQVNENGDLGKEEACIIWPTAKNVRWSFFAAPKTEEVSENTPREDKDGWKDTWEEKDAPIAIRAHVSDSLSETPIEVTCLIISQLHKVKIQGTN